MKKFGKSISRVVWFVSLFVCVAIHPQKSSAQNKSTITITYPISSTVWETNEPAELQWKTQNIDTSKSIRFFLLRNKTVVQELGRFKNSGGAMGIRLAKNVGSGDNYQVMGIELFPNNKEQIAKYATGFFSIRNREADLRKKEYELAKSNATPSKVTKKKTRNQPTPSPPLPKEFEGRRISYVKNLTFDSERLKVKVWDHQEEDGDIVSIYLNGDLVLSKHLLTNDHQEFDIELDSEKANDFLLYAHNLGEVSPNTVSVEITSDKKSETITLNSYLRSCEAVLISVKK
ncbi:hypothetical protein [Flagellimonas meridianipacifica]|uniref:Uncharacterized protein n=1 Tax=Flagellimonas meridianipacifica TaxID=1080225 RepID=A0A2T0MIL6_9FLAO|nr:hypothetical protein [Allomuricauda pacifica]PRX57428.1 hypothetical protein CLV81_1432 [Allomuricauda pacifica]